MNKGVIYTNNLVFSLNATVPIFLVMLLGYLLRRTKLLTEEFANVANHYVFQVALPVLLFRDIAGSNIRVDFNPRFVLFCMIATTLMFAGTYLISSIFIKDKPVLGAFVQGSTRGSAAVLGIAFVENIYGNAAMAPMMIIAAVPLYNIYSVIILTFCSKDRETHKNSIRTAFVNILKNPIILGIFAGIMVSLSGISIPTIPAKTISYIASTATPVALLVVGASFNRGKALSKIKPTIVATLIKLIVLPGIFLPFAILFGLKGSELVAILVMLGAPTTVSCYCMAKNMGNDEVLTSSIIVLATLVSSITLTLWILVLKSLGSI